MLQQSLRTVQHHARKGMHQLRKQKGSWWKPVIVVLLGVLVWKNDIRLQLTLDTSKPQYASNRPDISSIKSKDTAPVAPQMAISNHHKTYVKRYAKLAIEEMKRYGIPASITLAQALHESGAGKSKIATHNNNHFGIKCFSRSCQKNHCSNFTDDSHKDFFKKYENVWASYRDHSLFLKKTRYEPLFDLPKGDYKAWAKGLKKAGYATDKKYPQKLIRLIERLNLQQYDVLNT